MDEDRTRILPSRQRIATSPPPSAPPVVPSPPSDHIEDHAAATQAMDSPQCPPPGTPAQKPADPGDDEETRLMASPHRVPKTPSPAPPAGDDERTIVYRPKTAAPPVIAAAVAGNPAPPPAETTSPDPVTGWLMIRKGPGRGYALTLGYGMHSVGRGEGQRLRLGFGDQGISRDRHFVVTYDGRGRRFYVSPGATTLAYLNGAPILQPHPLNAGDIISLGDTELAFVAFCGEKFDWQDA